MSAASVAVALPHDSPITLTILPQLPFPLASHDGNAARRGNWRNIAIALVDGVLREIADFIDNRQPSPKHHLNG